MYRLRPLLFAITIAGVGPAGLSARGFAQATEPGSPTQQEAAQDRTQTMQIESKLATGQLSGVQDSKRDTGTATAGTGEDFRTSHVPVAARSIYTVPAGTKVLLQLRSSINTKSAKAGDAVYLSSTFPVVVGTRIMIPSGVYVQGIVDNVTRAGRLKGRAQLNLHFTSIIFPNGSVVEIPGIINSLPGTSKRTVDREGKVTEDGNKGHDVAEAAKIGLEGAGIGTIGGAATGHPLEGAAIGGLGGIAVGAVVALFTRGDDINIENGTPVEMVLQRPLQLEDANLSLGGPFGGGSVLVPATGQAQPLSKPTVPRARVVCPPGGLGCS